MTVIVGFEFDNRVFLAGDVQGTGYNSKVIHTTPKVFNKKGVLFGYTSSYRFGQVLEHNLADPVVPQDDVEVYRWLITVLVPDIRQALKDNGFEKGGNCLIGVRGQLWELQDDFSVLRSVKGYSAVGSGYEYAIGALEMLQLLSPSVQLKYEQDVRMALARAVQVAGTHSPTVGTEAVVIST
jgi:ATP-dependent protease HslVU (ClpYQ) peptidase subunit